MNPASLFDTYILSEQLQSFEREAISAAHGISGPQLVADTDEDIAQSLINTHTFEPLCVDWNLKTLTHHDEVKERYIRDYGGIQTIPEHFMVIYIKAPCSGSSKLWLCIPDNHPMKSIEGYIKYLPDSSLTGSLSFEVSVQTNDNADQTTKVVKNAIERRQNIINQFIDSVNSQCEKYTNLLRLRLIEIVSDQRKRVKCQNDVLDKLDIPLKRKDDAPDFQKVKLVRQELPRLKNKSQITEYGITDDDYDYILKVIRLEGATHERLLRTFFKLEEEELRDLCLAHLNGHYQGLATGETFSGAGKTDIFVYFENRAAFIAELKIWHGEVELHKAIDQLDSYTTWRDCKCSIVLYNKNVKGFSDLRKGMIEALKNHKRFLDMNRSENGNEWRVSFRSSGDEKRIIIVHFFLFNLCSNQA